MSPRCERQKKAVTRYDNSPELLGPQLKPSAVVKNKQTGGRYRRPRLWVPPVIASKQAKRASNEGKLCVCPACAFHIRNMTLIELDIAAFILLMMKESNRKDKVAHTLRPNELLA